MPSTILSDNGVSSGSAGLKSTAASDGALALQTTTSGGTATTAVTIDTSQNVGVGTTTNTAGNRFYVVGSGIQLSGGTSAQAGLRVQYSSSVATITGINNDNNAYNPLAFYTSGTEAARIDSSGNLLVGTTTSDGKLSVSNSTLTNTARISDANASSTSDGVTLILAARNTTNNTFYALSYYNTGAGNFKFRVADSGNVTNTNNSYGAISDIKLKENITNATPKLEQLNQVRVVNYNFIGSDEKQLGVVAQELEQIFPGMIDESIDRDQEGNDLGTTTKSVKYSVFVPMLIKAIQEQQAIIEQLQADVAALKGTK